MANILIVDDAKFMRATLKKILEKENHTIVRKAKNGLEAIRFYQEMKPDLVIMDITMPVMNGIEAIKRIIEIDPKAKIIVCSAIGQQEVVVEAIELGAKDFIAKPFDERNLIETVERILAYRNE